MRRQSAPPASQNPASVTDTRSSRLPSSHRPAAGEPSARASVHFRPPKKNRPSAPPPMAASGKVNRSGFIVMGFLVDGGEFAGDPAPGVETAQRQAGRQQGQCPAVPAGVIGV